METQVNRHLRTAKPGRCGEFNIGANLLCDPQDVPTYSDRDKVPTPHGRAVGGTMHHKVACAYLPPPRRTTTVGEVMPCGMWIIIYFVKNKYDIRIVF
ncbi:hypothetical protein EVAR_37008_1 [Eumeta japonica]|uniref:Uncharacterized protein n=1 Tax=Eumeta variegata TaxID=151549 RepID=A0A4C1X1D0_EUMVA|nr:hypothetical protein EVAR_37008_1 [Eumeta japonica]